MVQHNETLHSRIERWSHRQRHAGSRRREHSECVNRHDAWRSRQKSDPDRDCPKGYTSVLDPATAAADTIIDFEHGIDKIDLSQSDISASQAGRQGFHFGAANGSSVTVGDLVYNAATGVLSGYVDGDAIADFQIKLANKPTLSAGDFML